MNKFIIFDTETTGLKVDTNQIAQLSYAIINSELEILKSKNFYFKVNNVEEEASAITGLTVDKLNILSGGKTFNDCSDEIFEDFNNANIICHNTKFDFGFIEKEFERINKKLVIKSSFCTMLNYKDKLKLRHHYYGYKFPKLEEVVNFLKIDKEAINNVLSIISDDNNIDYHDARYDIACTYLAFKSIGEKYSDEGFNEFLKRNTQLEEQNNNFEYEKVEVKKIEVKNTNDTSINRYTKNIESSLAKKFKDDVRKSMQRFIADSALSKN